MLDGGLPAWAAAGHAVERGEPAVEPAAATDGDVRGSEVLAAVEQLATHVPGLLSPKTLRQSGFNLRQQAALVGKGPQSAAYAQQLIAAAAGLPALTAAQLLAAPEYSEARHADVPSAMPQRSDR